MVGSSLFLNLARAAKVLVLLLFFLPWVTVSCSPDALERMQAETRGGGPQAPPSMGSPPNVVIARASGLNMAMGSIEMALPSGSDSPGGSGATSGRPPQLAPEVGIIAGAALLLLALAATFFLKGAAAASAGAAGSVLATLAFCYSVFVSYPPAVLAAFAAGRREGNVSADQIGQILSVKPETLFYLVLILLVLAIVFNIMAMRKPGTASTPAESAP
jgi:hypothetical protein